MAIEPEQAPHRQDEVVALLELVCYTGSMGNSNWLMRLINGRISVPTWLMMYSNFIIGIILLLVGLFDPTTLGELGTVLPFGGVLLGGMLTLACTLTTIGMVRLNRCLTKWGAAIGWFTWIFGLVLFLSIPSGGYNALAFVLPDLLYFGYMYLAAVFRVKHMELKD